MPAPDLWWSPEHGLISYAAPDEYNPDGVWWRHDSGRMSLRYVGLPNELPADAVRLVPAAQGDVVEQEAAIQHAAVVLHESGCSGEHCAGLCMENATNLANEGLLASAPLHEWRCPGCGATTRARMADHPAPTKAQESETLVSPDDETVVTVAGALHPAMRSLALFTPEGEAKAAVILARAAISALGGQPNTEESR